MTKTYKPSCLIRYYSLSIWLLKNRLTCVTNLFCHVSLCTFTVILANFRMQSPIYYHQCTRLPVQSNSPSCLLWWLISHTDSPYIWETKIHVYLVTLILQNQIPRLRCPVTSLFDVMGHQHHYTLSSSMLHPTHHNFSKPWLRCHGIWFCKINVAHTYSSIECSLFANHTTSLLCSIQVKSIATHSNKLCYSIAI
jgi:hypothetical protein